MANLIAFLNAFLSYLLLFVVCVAVIVAAVRIGIGLRKRKDAKDEGTVAVQKAQEEPTESR